MDNTALHAAATLVAAASKITVLTGAGISAESGVPTFRGPEGLWRQFRPEDLATPEAFARDPGLVWEWYRWRRSRLTQVRPNPGHEMLARLEQRVPAFTLATQNVDGLHRQAGSRRVLELHGSIWRSVCHERCGVDLDEAPWATESASHAPAPAAPVPRCRCGALLRPGVVWFGEPLPADVFAEAVAAARAADVVLVVGTSGLVYPAASLPSLARQAGAAVIEVNVDTTPLSAEADLVLRGPAGVVLPALEALL